MWQHRRRPPACKECRDVSRQLSIASIAAQAVSRNDTGVENRSLHEAFRRSAIERRGKVFLEKSPRARAMQFLLLLLLLLHLLHVDEGDSGRGWLLCALDENAPIFGDGQLAVEGGRLIAGFDLHGDV
jgi:hypothetical protein